MANPDLIKSFVAEAAVNPFRIVALGATDGAVLQGAAATDLLIGVSGSIGQATVGGRIDIVLDDIADVEYGGTVTRGQKLTADANGKAVVAAPATGVNNEIIGRAMVSGVVGDIGQVLIAHSTLQG